MTPSIHTQCLNLITVHREVLTHICNKYSISKRQFEVLACSNAVQTEDKPYFLVPWVVRVSSISQPRIYIEIKELVKLEYISKSIKFNQRYKADVYVLTGSGLGVLKSYTMRLKVVLDGLGLS